MKNICYLLFVIVLCTACSSIKFIDIETYNPAEVTFPGNVSNILLVNNAVPQTPNSGYTYTLYGVEQDTCRAQADSALFDAPRTLGKQIADADYFEDVLLYHLPTRKDTVFLADGKFTSQQVKDLCAETGTDAIISFDRLLFSMKRDVVAFSEGYVSGSIHVDIKGLVRAYIPERENPLVTIVVADSVGWLEFANNLETLEMVFLPTPENTLRVAAAYVCNGITPNFVPHWNSEKRWYYKGSGSSWKKATAYASAEKWELAAERWANIYESASDKTVKAKTASNLALSEEMKGNFQKAYEWATRSQELFKEKKGESSNHAQLLTLYANTLKERIQSDKKLNIQFGEE